ncbi:hypothetical protein ACVWY2_003362 [Bradyrhizobium sp. JR6.1]
MGYAFVLSQRSGMLRANIAFSAAWTIKTPHFQPEKTRNGRWFVAVKTGNGPDSHIGDFDTEADPERWIATKAKYWPGKES